MNQAEVDATVEADSKMKDLAHRAGFTVDALYDAGESTYIILSSGMKKVFECDTRCQVLAFLTGVLYERGRDS